MPIQSTYFNHLLNLAQVDMPEIQHNLEGASTVLALQAEVKRLHKCLNFLMHHVLLDGNDKYNFEQPAPPVAPPVQQPQVPQFHRQYSHPGSVGTPPATSYYPGLQPQVHVPAIIPQYQPPPVFAQPQPLGRGVAMDVVITPEGTQVSTPTGQVVRFAPGQEVNVNPTPAYNHPQYAPAPPAPAQHIPASGDVVLPQGGAFTPEVERALSAARENPTQPIVDVARNITSEQPPG